MSLGGIIAKPELFQNSANFVLYLVETLGVHAQNLANKANLCQRIITIAPADESPRKNVTCPRPFRRHLQP
jgi:hypothetical protein